MIKIIPPNRVESFSSSLYLNIKDSPEKSNHLMKFLILVLISDIIFFAVINYNFIFLII